MQSSVQMLGNTDQKNSEYGHFLRSETDVINSRLFALMASKVFSNHAYENTIPSVEAVFCKKKRDFKKFIEILLLNWSKVLAK